MGYSHSLTRSLSHAPPFECLAITSTLGPLLPNSYLRGLLHCSPPQSGQVAETRLVIHILLLLIHQPSCRSPVNTITPLRKVPRLQVTIRFLPLGWVESSRIDLSADWADFDFDLLGWECPPGKSLWQSWLRIGGRMNRFREERGLKNPFDGKKRGTSLLLSLAAMVSLT